MRKPIKIFCAFLFMVFLLGCNSVKQVETPETDFEWNLKYSTQGTEVIITGYKGTSTDIVIPQKINMVINKKTYGVPVSAIGKGAFKDYGLTSVIIPDSVTVIGEGAFRNNWLTSITIPENVTEIGQEAFEDNPLNEVIITKRLHLLTWNVFTQPLSGVLPPGKYVLVNEDWLIEDSDGTLLSLQSYYKKLIKNNHNINDPSILADFVYIAVMYMDAELLRDCISQGIDVNSRMLNGRRNTPLAEMIRINWQWSNYDYMGDALERLNEMITVLLEAGAVPQYWMLCYSYYTPAVIKILLEYGALTHPESREWGDPPEKYSRPESLLLFYCNKLDKKFDSRGYGRLKFLITESAAMLLEYGEDPNYRNPDTGQTPLSIAMDESVYGTVMAELLIKHVSRPLSREEYRLLIGLYRDKSYSMYDNSDREDPLGFNALVLEDIRNGLLNPGEKDSAGKDIFDYAAATGTADLMKGLLPYLQRSGRTVFAVNSAGTSTGLYFEAVNARNFSVAEVLFPVTSHKSTVTDVKENTYSLEYHNFDYKTIYDSAQRISGGVLRSGPVGNRIIGNYRLGYHGGEIDYIPDKRFIIRDHYRQQQPMHTIDGSVIDLGAAVDEQMNISHRENNMQRAADFFFSWRTADIFSNTLFVETAYNRDNYMEYLFEYTLIDISGGRPSVYIMDAKSLPPVYLWDAESFRIGVSLQLDYAWDFVIYSGKAYLFTNSGEAVVFNIDGHTLRYERTVPFRELRIPGWKGSEWIFVSDGIVTVYNLSTGTVRALGREVDVEKRGNYYGYYFYEDTNGRRFVVESNSGKTYPMPEVEYVWFVVFDRGYMYSEKGNRHINICFFENGALKRKIILSGSAVGGPSVYGNTLYIGRRHLAFKVDLTSMRVIKAFSSEELDLYSGYSLYMFPFGADDIVYGEAYYDGDR